MKKEKMKKVIMTFILFFSLIINKIFSYCFYNNEKYKSSLFKWGFSDYNIEIYFERTKDAVTQVSLGGGSIRVGNAELRCEEDLYLVSPYGTVNLSETGGDAFVISSDGEIRYQMIKP